MCFYDSRFGRHPRWRFLIFNILMRRKANSSARFYVSKASGFKDMSRDELTEALLADESRLGNDPIRIDPNSILDRITRIRIRLLRLI